jgi:Neuraminidase (sialidase)
MLSRDAGLTWSQPIKIANWFPEGVSDPDNGAPVRTGNGLPDLAVDPSSGTIYAVWEDGSFSSDGHADIAFSKSSDGGHKWTQPVKVNQSPSGVQAFTPEVAVSADGTVGVTYYDFRNNTTAGGVPTDAWFVHSHDGGATWTEQHVAGPFDIEKAPVAGGYFLGDYEGLATSANDFIAFFVATTADAANPTDVFSVRLAK